MKPYLTACLILFAAHLISINVKGQKADSTISTTIVSFSRYLKDSGQIEQSVISSLNKFIPLKNIPQPKGIVKQIQVPLSFKSPLFDFREGNLIANVSNTIAGADNTQPLLYKSLSGTGRFSIFNLPFSLDYSSNSGFHNYSDQLSFGKSQFDKDAYLEQIKKKIRGIAPPEVLFKDALNEIYTKRDQAFSIMKENVKNVLKDNGAKLFNDKDTKFQIENLTGVGTDQFLNIIIEEVSAEIELKEIALERLGISNRHSDSLRRLNEEILRMRDSKHKIETELASLKVDWFNNGILETVNAFEKEKRLTIEKLMDDPAVIKQIAGEQLKLPFLQKILLYSKSLNIGSSGIKQSAYGLQDALLKGINLEYLKGNQFFSPAMGTLPGIVNLTDLAYANSGELPDIRTAAVRMGKGDIQSDFSHISVSVFQQVNNNQQVPFPGLAGSLPKNLVATYSKKVSFSETQSLLAEFSKSTMLYNYVAFDEANAPVNNNMKDGLMSGNFWENMGLTLDYNGEFESLGISEKLTVRYTGKEYSNMGNYSLASGTKEISNQLGKHFINRKLLVNMKANYREYDFSFNNRKWKSFSYTTDVKWKLKKGEYIAIRYQPYFNRRVTSEQSFLSSKSYRISLKGSVNRQVWHALSYRNFIEISSSKNDVYELLQDKINSSGFISFTSFQTLALGKQTLFFNTTVNRAAENTGYFYGNSSLSMDGGITFNVLSDISMSSALAYNGISEMYKQLAIRQSLSAVLGKRIVLDGFISAGKNLYRQPGLHIPPVNGSLSITYNLK